MFKRTTNSVYCSTKRMLWEEDAERLISLLDSVSCCKNLRCFQNFNPAYLAEKIKDFRSCPNSERKEHISSMLASDTALYFDGGKVCGIFLLI